MILKKRLCFISILLIICFLLSACGGKDDTAVEKEHNGTAVTEGVHEITFAEAGEEIDYYFNVPEDGVYSIEGSGGTSAEIHFFENDKYKSEKEPALCTDYPNEEYSRFDYHEFIYPIRLEKGDTVYFSLKGTDATEYSLSIQECLLVPDKTSCEELLSRFSGGFYSFNYDTISLASPEAEFKSQVKNLILGSCTTGKSGMANMSCIGKAVNGSMPDGSDIEKYISAEEASQHGIGKSTYYIYDASAFAAMPGELWGSGRVDDLTGEDTGVLLTGKGYLFVEEDKSYATPYFLLGITGYEGEGTNATASVVGLGYDEFTPTYDVNTKEPIGVNVFLEAYSSLLETSNILNIDPASLTPAEFTFYNTAEGTRLWSAGDKTPAAGDCVVPSLPEVIPESFYSEQIRTVSAVGGAQMKTSPDASSATIITVPDKINIRIYAEQDGFSYVKYMGIYGWIPTKNCK